MRTKYMKNKTSIHIGIILLVTTLIMFFLTMTMYFKISKPEFYKVFIDTGNKFLKELKYEEAILEFEKAIYIEPKSIEARIGNGKSYIGIDKLDTAVEEFKEAQNLDIENTKILLEILEILKDIDSESAYHILQNYIDKTQNTIPDNIQQIINNSNKKPNSPIINPAPGKYINPINLELQLDKLVVGYTIYYTLDGSEPSKESTKYSDSIDINKDTTIKLIVYNHKGESSEVITLEYFIDTDMMNKIQELIKQSEELVENTEEGTDVGNCIKGSKKKINNIIEDVKKSLDKDSIDYDTGNEIYEKLNNALEEFKYNIIEKTDKSKLKETINKAQNIHDKEVEGKKDGQHKVGSKAKLLNVIKGSQKVYDDILSKQDDLDNSVYSLNQAINTFSNSKVITFNKDIAMQYIIKQYGKPFRIHEVCDVIESDNTVCYLEYSFSSDMLVENGLKYYTMVMGAAYCGVEHPFIDEHKVYENGVVEFYRDTW